MELNNAIANAEDKVRKEEQEKAEKEKAELQAKADAEKRESAKKMLLKGLDASDVADIIGLSLEEINKIKKKVQ